MRKKEMPVDAVSPHTQLVRQQFALFEEFSEAVRGWDLDFCQTTRADAPFYLEQLAGPSVLVSRAYLSSGFYQMGGATPGCRTVSIFAPGTGASRWRWCGEAVNYNSLLVMPVGGEFESISAPNFDSIHVALPVSLLEEVACEQFDLPLHKLMPDSRCFCPEGGKALRALRLLLQGLTHGHGEACGPQKLSLTSQLEREMAYLVLACLASMGAEMPCGPRSKRMRCFARAVEMINETGAQDIGVSQLVAALGVSRRTLENAFMDGVDVGPGAFIKSRRLQQFHRALLQANRPALSVSTLAEQHNFHHLGQLAADYKQLFGELPSETFKRNRVFVS